MRGRHTFAWMISVDEAMRLVLDSVGSLPSERCKLHAAQGRTLRAAVRADRDGPPFDRATLDGVCLRFAEWEAGRREFTLAGTQAAGAEPVAAPGEGACLEIMTGAPVPAPCDAVVRVEDLERSGDRIRIRDDAKFASGTGIHRRGSDFAAGATLLEPGCRLTGRELAIAASCGCSELEVTVEPRIAVLTTGDELVDVDDEPKPHQIRRSNDLALKAVLQSAGFSRIELNHLPDNAQAISWNMERLLQQADVVIVTGGVSKGRFDHLPAVLEDLGVTKHFHGVAQRPGKPMFFGTFARPGDFLHPEDTRVVAVFALPGNPVSSFTCAHRYVLPGLDRMSGRRPAPAETVALVATTTAHPELTLFLPVRRSCGDDGRGLAAIQSTNTSGDFASIATTDGFVEVSAGTPALAAGSAVRFFSWT